VWIGWNTLRDAERHRRAPPRARTRFAERPEDPRQHHYVLKARTDPNGRRCATLTDPYEAPSGATDGVPDRLVEAAAHNRAVGAGRTCPTPMTGQRLDKNWQGPFSALETRFPAAERSFPVSDGDFSVEEIAQIAALITCGGQGKTAVVRAMRGHAGRKHKADAAYHEHLGSAIAATRAGWAMPVDSLSSGRSQCDAGHAPGRGPFSGGKLADQGDG
jgi:hypothetical protein